MLFRSDVESPRYKVVDKDGHHGNDECSHEIEAASKERNFSSPRPNRLVNFWWKRATSLHDEVTQAFMAISKIAGEYPQGFAKGKTSLLPKPGEFF